MRVLIIIETYDHGPCQVTEASLITDGSKTQSSSRACSRTHQEPSSSAPQQRECPGLLRHDRWKARSCAHLEGLLDLEAVRFLLRKVQPSQVAAAEHPVLQPAPWKPGVRDVSVGSRDVGNAT